MSYTKKPFEELNVLDDFMFNAIATSREVGEDFCRTILSVLLQRKIGRINIIAQHSIAALTPNHRGIRMDVEVEELELASGEYSVMNVYDVEPHLKQEERKVLVRHNRFYQAKIDSRYMKRGENDFAKMPNLYILTITDFDPFGYDYMMYSVQNQCREIPEMDYPDGVHFLYFYTDGKNGGNTDIQTLLQYMRESTGGNVRDEATQKVNDMMNQVRVHPEVKLEYMKFDEIIYYERKEAAEEAAAKATAEATKKNATDNAIEFIKNGASLELVEKSIKALSKEEIRDIYDEVTKTVS